VLTAILAPAEGGWLTEAGASGILAQFPPYTRNLGRSHVKPHLILTLIDEAYEKHTWHGPNLKQSIRGVNAKQAAWRVAPGRHNIWEVTLHAAYWKYTVRRRIDGGKRGSFALKGSNFFARPEQGKRDETAWRADKDLLEREHRALRAAIDKVLRTPRGMRLLRQLYGIAFHDVYHAGQIRLLRRLMRGRVTEPKQGRARTRPPALAPF
jgi:hypothetical protein